MATASRIWASDDGESHLDDVELAFEESDFLSPAIPMLMTAQEKAAGYFISRAPAGLELDWHTAPVRELAVCLTGRGEIEASDGWIRPIEPGRSSSWTTPSGKVTRLE